MSLVLRKPVMHDSDSGIGIDSGITPIFTGIRIGIKNIKKLWNLNRNQEYRNQAFRVSLESESEITGIMHHCRKPSVIITALQD